MTRTIDLALNPNLDPAPYAEIYKREKLVQIPDILPNETADAIREILERSLRWRLVFPEPAPGSEQDRVVYLTQEEMASSNRQDVAARLRGVMDRAKDNYGYLYNCYPMIEAYVRGWDAGHPIHQVADFLNSAEFLEFGRQVIGAETITKAEAQATLYQRGHFLTRHVDEGYDKQRRAAYTFGFTRRWQPDWGGMLMFLDGNLDVTRALIPRFNVLSLFDGTMIHSVSAVSPFAPEPRLQITGWLCDDPAYRSVSEQPTETAP